MQDFFLIELNIELVKVNGKWGIQFRKRYGDKEFIKQLISDVLVKKKVMAEIKFKNELLVVPKLREKGLY